MVESVVFFAAERLGDFLIQNAVSFEGAHQQVVRLRAELMRMQCILNDADTRQEDNAGVHKCFIYAAAYGVTVVEILEPAYVPPIVHSFFLRNGTQNCSGVSEQLLAVQVTELLDGIFIGCTINHMRHFFNSWLEISGVPMK
ncbi:hypothetical protein AAG906_021156 [Vitis piasezkii]